MEFYIVTNQSSDESVHVVNHRVEIENARFQHLATAECQQLAGECSRTIRGLADLLHFVAHWIALSDFAQHQVAVALDDREEIVEIVSDATRESSYGFHFLRMAKLVLKLSPFGDVFGD